MAIGKTSRMSSVRSSLRAPKFLDKASGFYERLDEPAGAGAERDGEEEKQNNTTNDSGPTTALHGQGESGEAHMETCFDFSEGLMEDDGETLLRRKPSRRSSRWRRSSRRKQKEEVEAKPEEESGPNAAPAPTPEVTGTEPEEEAGLERAKKEMEGEEGEEGGRGLSEEVEVEVHIHFREEEDDQVLIRDKKRGREEEEGEEEEEEERRMRREQQEGMKVVKRHTVKNYRKALDRAFRRGWEAFVTNLHSVTLTPVSSSSSSSPSSKTGDQHNTVLAEFR